MKKALIVAALVAVLTLALLGAALAQQAPTSGSVGKKDVGARLDKAKERLAKAIERAQKMKERALEKAKKAEARFKEITDELKAQGKDISKLVADRDVLESKVKTAEADYEALVSKLKEAQGLASENTVEQFRAALKSARELKNRVRADVKEIRQYRKTLVQDIRSLGGRGEGKQKQGAQSAPAI